MKYLSIINTIAILVLAVIILLPKAGTFGGDGFWNPSVNNYTVVTSSPSGVTGSIQFKNAGVLGSSAALFWDNSNSRLGVGTSTPLVTFQATTPAANTTTTIEFGKVGQNKGLCLKTYNVAGTVTYCSIAGTTLSCSATSCQ